MLYCATSGCEVAATAVSGGVKFPDPHPSDARVDIMAADRQTTTSEFFKRASPREHRRSRGAFLPVLDTCVKQILEIDVVHLVKRSARFWTEAIA
jgi:hypothetical protein